MRFTRRYIVIFCIAMSVFVTAVYFYGKFSPTDSDIWFPQCPVKLLTGLSCPACGIQRAVHAFLNNRWGEALTYNYFFVISIPYAIGVCVASVLRKIQKASHISDLFEHRVPAMIYVYCFFAWFIIRNIFEI